MIKHLRRGIKPRDRYETLYEMCREMRLMLKWYRERRRALFIINKLERAKHFGKIVNEAELERNRQIRNRITEEMPILMDRHYDRLTDYYAEKEKTKTSCEKANGERAYS